MTLQSSGAISLNDIHVEAGGSSGTSVGINDSDVRGLTGASSGASSSFSSFYGTSSTWSRIMTVGHSGTKDSANQIMSNSTGMTKKHWDPIGSREFVGYLKGSFSPDGLFDNGATIECLHFYSSIPIKGDFSLSFEFCLIGTYPNSGWNNLIMDNGMGGTVTLARTSMTFNNVAAGAAGNQFGTPPYPTTIWRQIYAVGGEGSLSTPAVRTLRGNYFRIGTGHNFPLPTGPNSLTPPLFWSLNKQINITIN